MQETISVFLPTLVDLHDTFERASTPDDFTTPQFMRATARFFLDLNKSDISPARIKPGMAIQLDKLQLKNFIATFKNAAHTHTCDADEATSFKNVFVDAGLRAERYDKVRYDLGIYLPVDLKYAA